jgi:hypothetical protein
VMKSLPTSEEFTRFTGAVRQILKISKKEPDRRVEEDRRRRNSPKISSSRDSDASSKES